MIKLKDLLKEEYIGDFVEYSGRYQIFINPKSIKRMESELRGLSLPNGDLIVIDNSMDVTHQMLAKWLNKNGYNLPMPVWKENAISKGYFTWQRHGSSNKFYLGESANESYIKRNLDVLKIYIENVRLKNKQYKFILKRR